MLCQAFAVSLGLWDEPREPHSLAGSQREASELLRGLADRTEVPCPPPPQELPLHAGSSGLCFLLEAPSSVRSMPSSAASLLSSHCPACLERVWTC